MHLEALWADQRAILLNNSHISRRWPVPAFAFGPSRGRPGSLEPQQGIGFQQLVIPASSTTTLPDLTSLARYRDGGSTLADGSAKTSESHTLYAFPFTLQQLILFRALCVAGSLEQAAQTLQVTTNHLQMVLGRLEKELNIGLVSQKAGFSTLW